MVEKYNRPSVEVGSMVPHVGIKPCINIIILSKYLYYFTAENKREEGTNNNYYNHYIINENK